MKSLKIIVALSILLGAYRPLAAQNPAPGDSLSLKAILTQVMDNYPAIKKSLQEQNSSAARIDLAKAAYRPDVSLNGSYTHVDPVSSFELPGLGSMKLSPSENFAASINYSQIIYDFGRTSNAVAVEQQSNALAALSTAQLKQRLSYGVVNGYYAILFLQEAIRIKEEQLNNLNEHLYFVEKKRATGSATQYEILTTNVKISAIENQKTDLQTALKVQSSQLNALLGQPQQNRIVVKLELQPMQALGSGDSLCNQALAARLELKQAQQKAAVSELRLKSVHAQYNPSVNIFGRGGINNGYEPDINKGTWNYAIGVGIRVPIYDGGRTSSNLRVVKADLEGNNLDVELARRNILNEVTETESNTLSAVQKIEQSKLQGQQAAQAYALAVTSFQSGVITNLELLDSATSLSEARLALLKANIDYSLSLLKLKLSVGQLLY